MSTGHFLLYQGLLFQLKDVVGIFVAHISCFSLFSLFASKIQNEFLQFLPENLFSAQKNRLFLIFRS
jgi:hypothetical protein